MLNLLGGMEILRVRLSKPYSGFRVWRLEVFYRVSGERFHREVKGDTAEACFAEMNKALSEHMDVLTELPF